MKACKFCHGAKTVIIYGEKGTCPVCNGTGEHKKQTIEQLREKKSLSEVKKMK